MNHFPWVETATDGWLRLTRHDATKIEARVAELEAALKEAADRAQHHAWKMRAAYDAKAEDFAKETLRASKLHDRVATLENALRSIMQGCEFDERLYGADAARRNTGTTFDFKRAIEVARAALAKGQA
jgi:hypothetical protein